MTRAQRTVIGIVAVTLVGLLTVGCAGSDTTNVRATADETPITTEPTTTTSVSPTSTSTTVEDVGIPCEGSMLLEAARAAEAIDPAAEVTVEAHRCVETYAYANFSLTNGDGADAYFRYALPGMGWRLIDLGSDVDTTTLGIPDDVLAQLTPTR